MTPTTGRWWVFDKPVGRDPLFAAAVICGVAAAAAGLSTRGEDASVFAQVFNVVGGAGSGFFAVGVVGGVIRNFIRGYRGNGPGSAPE